MGLRYAQHVLRRAFAVAAMIAGGLWASLAQAIELPPPPRGWDRVEYERVGDASSRNEREASLFRTTDPRRNEWPIGIRIGVRNSNVNYLGMLFAAPGPNYNSELIRLRSGRPYFDFNLRTHHERGHFFTIPAGDWRDFRLSQASQIELEFTVPSPAGTAIVGVGFDCVDSNVQTMVVYHRSYSPHEGLFGPLFYTVVERRSGSSRGNVTERGSGVYRPLEQTLLSRNRLLMSLGADVTRNNFRHLGGHFAAPLSQNGMINISPPPPPSGTPTARDQSPINAAFSNQVLGIEVTSVAVRDSRHSGTAYFTIRVTNRGPRAISGLRLFTAPDFGDRSGSPGSGTIRSLASGQSQTIQVPMYRAVQPIPTGREVPTGFEVRSGSPDLVWNFAPLRVRVAN